MVAKNAFLNGISLAYDEVGAGPAVLLVHGFPLNRQMWRPQMAILVAAGYRVIAPDLRGFGGSDVSDGPCDMDLLADDLLELLDHLGIDQAVVVGMSMGGYLLFNLLERYPQRVSAAVFAVTRSVADDEAGRARRKQLADQVIRFGPQVVADSFQELLFAPDTVVDRPRLAAEVYGWMVATASQGLAAGLLAMKQRRDATPLLQAITVPCLSIGADQDRACPLEHPRMIAAGIPGCRLCIIPGAGHMANLEQPGDFNRVLLTFLREIVPTPLNLPGLVCDCSSDHSSGV
ncbi:MAG: alpha/beta fold hydrolase [Trichlorobacter sp.]|jgi:pimeloyl-ACP methyl ester carboxylesterase